MRQSMGKGGMGTGGAREKERETARLYPNTEGSTQN